MSGSRNLLNIALAVSVLCGFTAFTPSLAASPRQQVNSSLRTAQTHTEQLVKNVASFLQMTGRWAPAPQGKDMQLCQALQTFQQQLSSTSKNNGSQPLNSMQFQLQQLQTQAQNVGQLVNQVGANAVVLNSWNQVQADMASVNQALYAPNTNTAMNNFYDSEPSAYNNGYNNIGNNFAPGGFPFGGNQNTNTFNSMIPGSTPFTPPNNFNTNTSFNSFAPGNSPYSPNPYNNNSNNSSFNGFGSNNMGNALSSADRSTNKLISQVSNFLQRKGKWLPQAGTPELQLCQELQTFQQNLQKTSKDFSSRVSYSTIQSELQQLNTSSQNIDRLMLQVGATPDVGSKWGKVRSDMNSVMQSFYTLGNGYLPL